jgi:hypothetical protein
MGIIGKPREQMHLPPKDSLESELIQCAAVIYVWLENRGWNRSDIAMAIATERKAQDDKWGDQSRHSLLRWYTILAEEVGEVAKAVLES